MNICVFCSSSDRLKKEFYEIAEQLGKQIAKNNHTLVYGGAKVGIMGVLAASVKNNGGKVIGVIPEKIKNENLQYTECDSLIVTRNMSERKEKMEQISDAFITLPGGFGTMEEVLEIITLRQLEYHRKAIVFIDALNFYDPLFKQFENCYSENFTKKEFEKIYFTTESAADALNYLENYEPLVFESKWYKANLNV